MNRYIKKGVTADTQQGGDGIVGFTARLLASGVYVGYVPVAQGTVGSLWGIVIPCVLSTGWYVWLWPLTGALLAAGIWAANRCERYWGHDPGRVVIDEVVGMLVAILGFGESHYASIPFLAVAFLLFRFFDIVKPWPVNWADKTLPGGWGVMLDDVLAGVYGSIVLRLLLLVLPMGLL